MEIGRPAPPSWQPDPFARHQQRRWSGTAWTDQVLDDGVAGIDPAGVDPAPAGAEPDRRTTPITNARLPLAYRPANVPGLMAAGVLGAVVLVLLALALMVL